MGLIGENIKKYRAEKKITQKELADKLFVTAQAVSRWENSEVEPSINTIIKIAEIFEITVDELCGKETEIIEPTIVDKYVYEEPQRQHLALCETCNKPIYESYEIIRYNDYNGNSKVMCRECDIKKKKNEKLINIQRLTSERKKSFILSGILASLYLIVACIICISNDNLIGILLNLGIAICIFTCISCLVLDNNCIEDIILGILSWGFVRMPGLIFELSLDGFIWLITVKLVLWIIQISISILVGIFAIVFGGILSLFIYPFALNRNISETKK